MVDWQDDGYEQAIFIPSERSEDMAQLNLGVQFLRLGTWDDASSVRYLRSWGTLIRSYELHLCYLQRIFHKGLASTNIKRGGN